MKISIIIPVYNSFKELKKCLKSIAHQTVLRPPLNPPLSKGGRSVEVEIIIVNDGSQHSSRVPFVPELKDKIQYFEIEHSGAAKARNFGFDKSTGDYVFFCDADVVFLKKNALEKMIQTLENNPDKAYCYSGFMYGFKAMPCFAFDADKLKQNNYISTMSMIRRNKFPRFSAQGEPASGWDERLKRFQDWDLWLTLLKRGETGVFIKEILWRASGGGKMSAWLPRAFYKLPVLKNTKKVKEFEEAKKIVKQKHGL